MKKWLCVAALACLAVTPVAATQRAPQAITTLDGRRFVLGEQAGKWVVINYWATWCVPCIAEMPILSALAVERPQIVVIGLTTETIAPEALRAFLAKRPVSYPIAVVDKANVPRKFTGTMLGMQARPLTYIVRPDGTLAARFLGELTAAKVKTVIDAR